MIYMVLESKKTYDAFTEKGLYWGMLELLYIHNAISLREQFDMWF